MQLHLDPVTDAAVLPLEGGDQRLLWELEAEWELVSTRRKDRYLPVICSREGKKVLFSFQVHGAVRVTQMAVQRQQRHLINSDFYPHHAKKKKKSS